jgi:hypothetical protein
VMWVAWTKPSGNLPKGAWIFLLWFLLAIVLSIACLVREYGVQESRPEATAHADLEQFGRLLSEHRKEMANKRAPLNSGPTTPPGNSGSRRGSPPIT